MIDYPALHEFLGDLDETPGEEFLETVEGRGLIPDATTLFQNIHFVEQFPDEPWILILTPGGNDREHVKFLGEIPNGFQFKRGVLSHDRTILHANLGSHVPHITYTDISTYVTGQHGKPLCVDVDNRGSAEPCTRTSKSLVLKYYTYVPLWRAALSELGYEFDTLVINPHTIGCDSWDRFYTDEKLASLHIEGIAPCLWDDNSLEIRVKHPFQIESTRLNR